MMNMVKETKVTCQSFKLLTLGSLNLIIYYASVSVTCMTSHRIGHVVMPGMDGVSHEPFLARQIKITYYIQNFSWMNIR